MTKSHLQVHLWEWLRLVVRVKSYEKIGKIFELGEKSYRGKIEFESEIGLLRK